MRAELFFSLLLPWNPLMMKYLSMQFMYFIFSPFYHGPLWLLCIYCFIIQLYLTKLALCPVGRFSSLYWAVTATKVLIVSSLSTEAKLSWKLISCFCVKRLATSLVLLSTPILIEFSLVYPLHPNNFPSFKLVNKFPSSFFLIIHISSFIALIRTYCFQLLQNSLVQLMKNCMIHIIHSFFLEDFQAKRAFMRIIPHLEMLKVTVQELFLHASLWLSLTFLDNDIGRILFLIFVPIPSSFISFDVK